MGDCYAIVMELRRYQGCPHTGALRLGLRRAMDDGVGTFHRLFQKHFDYVASVLGQLRRGLRYGRMCAGVAAVCTHGRKMMVGQCREKLFAFFRRQRNLLHAVFDTIEKARQ